MARTTLKGATTLCVPAIQSTARPYATPAFSVYLFFTTKPAPAISKFTFSEHSYLDFICLVSSPFLLNNVTRIVTFRFSYLFSIKSIRPLNFIFASPVHLPPLPAYPLFLLISFLIPLPSFPTLHLFPFHG